MNSQDSVVISLDNSQESVNKKHESQESQYMYENSQDFLRNSQESKHQNNTKSSESMEEVEEDICHLCFSMIGTEDRFRCMPCGHWSHYFCIEEWQRECLVKLDGLCPCPVCDIEISNLSRFSHKNITKSVSLKQTDLSGFGITTPRRTNTTTTNLSPILEDGQVPTTTTTLKKQNNLPNASTVRPVTTPMRQTRLQTLVSSTVTRARVAHSKFREDVVLGTPQRIYQARVQEKLKMDIAATQRQEKQAMKMKKRYVDHLPEINIGDIVCISVDKRDRKVQNNRGIFGVVSKVASSKSIQCITPMGWLVEKGQISWIHPGTFRIPNQRSPFSKDLMALQSAVREQKDHPAFALRKSKQSLHFDTHGMILFGSCGCTRKCSSTCGCRKAGRKCGSGCGCKAHGFTCDNNHENP